MSANRLQRTNIPLACDSLPSGFPRWPVQAETHRAFAEDDARFNAGMHNTGANIFWRQQSQDKCRAPMDKQYTSAPLIAALGKLSFTQNDTEE